jgi:hypothetical protein
MNSNRQTGPTHTFTTITTPHTCPAYPESFGRRKRRKSAAAIHHHSMQNTLGSHVVLLTRCERDLKSKLRQNKIVCSGNSYKLREKLFTATKADLVHTHFEVENVKKELNKLKSDFLLFSFTNEE